MAPRWQPWFRSRIKLTGSSGLYRLRVGSYRIAYQINDGELVILVVKVGGRRDVHRDL